MKGSVSLLVVTAVLLQGCYPQTAWRYPADAQMARYQAYPAPAPYSYPPSPETSYVPPSDPAPAPSSKPSYEPESTKGWTWPDTVKSWLIACALGLTCSSRGSAGSTP